MRRWLLPLCLLGLFACDDASGDEAGGDETTAAADVEVRWAEVIASDYTLELLPEFDASVTEYTALADEAGIEVWVEVLVTEDVETVSFNGLPGESIGFRAWRSPADVSWAAPAAVTVEVDGAPAYVFDVVPRE